MRANSLHVVPANAGGSYTCRQLAATTRPTITIGGYGSRRSPGRRIVAGISNIARHSQLSSPGYDRATQHPALSESQASAVITGSPHSGDDESFAAVVRIKTADVQRLLSQIDRPQPSGHTFVITILFAFFPTRLILLDVLSSEGRF